jgi:hypothetical protein
MKELDAYAEKHDRCKVNQKSLEKRFPKAAKIEEDKPDAKKRITVSVHCECAVAVRMLHELKLMPKARITAGDQRATEATSSSSGSNSSSSAGNTTSNQSAQLPPSSPPTHSQAVDKATPRRVLIKVGVSKRTCYICEKYLKTLSDLCDPCPGPVVGNGERLPFILTRTFSGKFSGGWQLPPDGPPAAADEMAAFLHAEVMEIITETENLRTSDSEPTELRLSVSSNEDNNDAAPRETFTHIEMV